MRKRSNFAVAVLIGVLVAIIILSCTEEQPSIGLQFIDDTSFELVSVDTVTMSMSTVLLDSAPTNTTGRLLVGKYDDPDLGLVRASAYLNMVSPVIEIDRDDDKVRYNYAVLRLRYNGYSHYDTTQLFNLSVLELSEEMEPDDESDFFYYNTSEFDTKKEEDGSPLGAISFYPKPNSNDEVEIILSDRLGKEVFDQTFNAEETVGLEDIIFGFKLMADEDNAAILGFQPEVELEINYTDFDFFPAEESTLSFVLGQVGDEYFTQIEYDNDNVLIQSILDSDSILTSDLSENQSYLMGGVGMALRVEMPYLRNILLDNPDIALDDVVLSLRPILSAYDGFRELPPLLEGSIVDRKNKLISSEISGFLIEDDEFDRDTQYLLDVKEYVELQLGLNENNNNAILITLPSSTYYGQVDQLIVGDGNNKENETKLMLNLIRLENE